MSILGLLLTIAIFGAIVFLILQIPMPVWTRNIVVAVAIIFLVLWVAQGFGIATPFSMRLK